MSNIVSQKYEQQVTKVEWIIPRKKKKIILQSIPCIHPYPHCRLSFSIVYKKLTNISLFFPKSPSGRQSHNRATTGLEQSDICLVSASHTYVADFIKLQEGKLMRLLCKLCLTNILMMRKIKFSILSRLFRQKQIVDGYFV